MRILKIALVGGLALLASSCSLTGALRHHDTPAEKVAKIVAEHPELLAKPETVQVKVYYKVPEIHFTRELVPVFDTVYVQRESGRLDSLMNQLQGRLDSAQRVTVRNRMQALLLNRRGLHPTDTLRFDTLGVRGKIWQVGATYHLDIVRRAVQGTARGPALVARLVALPPAPVPFYNPAGWPWRWWHWLLGGLVLGLLAGFLLCRTLIRRVNA
jgi:hypothetical protein